MSQETPASTTEAQIKNKRRISPFWLLPFIALMIAGWLIWDSYQDRGNTVTIDFMSADGIVPGRTPVRYQGVEVGTVQDISLSDDLRKIEVKVSIKSDMKDALREETQFWLVTPKASLAGVSGLDALVGGNYIGMMPGKGKEQGSLCRTRYPTEISTGQWRSDDPPASPRSRFAEQRFIGLFPQDPCGKSLRLCHQSQQARRGD